MKAVRRLARILGFELLPLRKAREPALRLVRALDRFAVDLVVDGGANMGQYGSLLRAAGWRRAILSIEPIPELRETLAARASADPAWHVVEPLALGARAGEANLQVSAESDMSSLLARTALLERLSPSSRPQRTIVVKIMRLEDIPALREGPWRRIFLKLDLQGYEALALEGVGGLWPRIVGVQVELALVELYERETGWRSMIDRLAGLGYVPWLFLPGYVEPKTGRELQMDGVFFRETALRDSPFAHRIGATVGDA